MADTIYSPMKLPFSQSIQIEKSSNKDNSFDDNADSQGSFYNKTAKKAFKPQYPVGPY